MVLVYNPSNCPHYVGPIELKPKNYTAVSPEHADLIRMSAREMLVEGSPDFPPLFRQYGPE